MAEVLMVGVGAHGHVHPNLPVIAELVARGHRVRYAIPETFADAVRATGAEPVVFASVVPDQSRGEQWPSEPVAGMSVFLDDAIGALPQIEAAIGDDRPDIVLYDIGGYPARILAQRWEVPLIQLSPSMVAWRGFDADMAEALGFRDSQEYSAYHERFSRWLAEQGVHADQEDFVGKPPRCLVLIPKALQPNADRVDESVYTFVGPALDRRAALEPPVPAPDRPLVVVSLGSAYTDQPEFYRDCIAAFAPLCWTLAINIGAHVDPADLGDLPENVTLHRWLPQFAMLANAAAFVTHAGMGGCAEGLYHGVPMIAVPQAVDQFGNADMLVRLGVARQLTADEVSAEALRTALLELTGSAEVARRLAQCSAELRAQGGAARAADLIEETLPR